MVELVVASEVELVPASAVAWMAHLLLHGLKCLLWSIQLLTALKLK